MDDHNPEPLERGEWSALAWALRAQLALDAHHLVERRALGPTTLVVDDRGARGHARWLGELRGRTDSDRAGVVEHRRLVDAGRARLVARGARVGEPAGAVERPRVRVERVHAGLPPAAARRRVVDARLLLAFAATRRYVGQTRVVAQARLAVARERVIPNCSRGEAPMDELPILAAATGYEKFLELLRVWSANGGQHVSLGRTQP